jgi:hypothetical protein
LGQRSAPSSPSPSRPAPIERGQGAHRHTFFEDVGPLPCKRNPCRRVAVEGYRSFRELVLPLGQLSAIVGAKVAESPNVYRSLRVSTDLAQNARLLEQQ